MKQSTGYLGYIGGYTIPRTSIMESKRFFFVAQLVVKQQFSRSAKVRESPIRQDPPGQNGQTSKPR